MVVVAGGGQVVGLVVAGGAAGAARAGQQAALGAVGALDHTFRHGEFPGLIPLLDGVHQGPPRFDAGAGPGLAAQGQGHVIGRVVTPPDGSHIVWGAAHEPQVALVGGGTRLAEGPHIARRGVPAARRAHAAVQDVLQQLVHDGGGLGGQGLVAGGVVFQIDVAVPVQHAGVEVRGGVLAVVEDLEGRRQVHRGDAVGLAAHDQRGQAHVVDRVKGIQLQGVVEEVEDGVGPHQVAHADGDGVQGAGQAVPQGDVGVVAVVAAVVLGPAAPGVGVGPQRLVRQARQAVAAAVVIVPDHHVALQVEGGVVQHGGPVDQPVLDAQSVGADGFDGRAGLPGDAVGAVEGQVAGLFAQAADHRDHIAVVVQGDHGRLGADIAVVGDGAVLGGGGLEGAVVVVDGDVVLRQAGHRLFMPAGGEIGVPGVQHQLFHLGLDLGVDGGLDGKAAGVQHLLGRRLGDALLLHDVLHHFLKEGVGEVGVVGGGGPGSVLLGQDQGLGDGLAVDVLGDDPLIPHIIKDKIAAVDQVFGVGAGVVVGGVFGDGSDGGAFPEGQLIDFLAKILQRSGLNALDGAGEADGVQVGFQDGLLGVVAVEGVGAVDLPQLAQRALDAAGAVVLGEVFDQLLLDGGCALPGAVNGHDIFVDHRAHGALEVEARLGVKILVLGADERVLQVLGDLLQVHPHPVAVGGAEGGVLDLGAGVRVGGHHHAGLAQLDLVQVQQVAVVGRGLHHIKHHAHRQRAPRHYPHAEQGGKDAEERPQDRMLWLFLFRLLLFGAAAALGCAGMACPPAAAGGRGRRGLPSAAGGVHHAVPRRRGAVSTRAVAAVDAPHFIHSEADRLLLNKAFVLPALSTFPAFPPGGQSAGLTRPGIACPCSDTWLL